MSDETPNFSIPLRRMTQAELDAFLEKAADILRGNVDHSEFRGYVFALLFFKRISDLFEEAVRKLAKQVGDELANDPAMQKKSLPFVVPPDSTWEAVTGGTPEKKVTSLQLGLSLNDAMLAIERANAPKFDGILTSKIDFNKTDELPRDKLVNLKNHFSSRKFDRAHVPDDLFGDAYEYLIRTFASKAGKSSGEFYTPREISYLMSEIIAPDEQHEVCDWASGSASLLLQCREYLRRHKKDPNRLFLYAQESNLTTYNISRINLILHGVNSWHPAHGDSLRDPKHKTSDGKIKQFDRVVMNPPFSLKDWGSESFTDGDPFDRFGYGSPPADNGDYTRVLPTHCTRGCGCNGHPAFPTPSVFQGRRIHAQLGRIASRGREAAPDLIARSDLSAVAQPAKAEATKTGTVVQALDASWSMSSGLAFARRSGHAVRSALVTNKT
jgi:type I restriction enzyme M protein